MIPSVHTSSFQPDTLPSEIATAIYLSLNTLADHKTPLRGPPGGRKTQSISFSLCDGCISLSIAEGSFCHTRIILYVLMINFF